MTQDDAFMEAIVENPDDDAVRLIYADWLDEHGEESRACFIRLQIEAARLPLGDCRREELEREAARLTPPIFVDEGKKIPQRWARSLPPELLRRSVEFHRGMPAGLGITAAEFCWFADDVFRAIPLQHLNLYAAGRRWRDVLASPHLPRLRSLWVHPSGDAYNLVGLRNNQLVWLAETAGLAGLTNLWLARVQFRHWGARALAHSPHLQQLSDLTLMTCSVGDGALVALTAAAYFPRLVKLNLAGSRLGSDEMGALLAAPPFVDLRFLNLHRTQLDDALVQQLAASPHLRELRSLHLGMNAITAAGAESLAASPHLGKLRDLDLGLNDLGDGGVTELLRGAFIPYLKTLRLNSNSLGLAGLRALAAAPELDGIVHLDVRMNPGVPEAKELLHDRFGDRVVFSTR